MALKIYKDGQWNNVNANDAYATKASLSDVATSGDYNDLENTPTIPTSLPTPYTLTFTGASTGTFNGSANVTINIPEGGTGSGDVTSVNGKTGTVVLSASDVGAATSDHTHATLTIGSYTYDGSTAVTIPTYSGEYS